jgi:hypothetical protein
MIGGISDQAVLIDLGILALGFLVTLYATLITLFGLAWVLFLIGRSSVVYCQRLGQIANFLGWINVGGKQLYMINVIDNVLVALFAIMGDGLAPFRAVDTYHMIFIAHYHHLTWKLRKKNELPELHNKNDLPSRCPPGEIDLERDGTGEADGVGVGDGEPGFQMQDHRPKPRTTAQTRKTFAKVREIAHLLQAP